MLWINLRIHLFYTFSFIAFYRNCHEFSSSVDGGVIFPEEKLTCVQVDATSASFMFVGT